MVRKSWFQRFAIHVMSVTTDFQFAQIEMSEIKWVRTESTIESIVADHAYEQTFGKLTLEEIILDFGSNPLPIVNVFTSTRRIGNLAGARAIL